MWARCTPVSSFVSCVYLRVCLPLHMCAAGQSVREVLCGSVQSRHEGIAFAPHRPSACAVPSSWPTVACCLFILFPVSVCVSLVLCGFRSLTAFCQWYLLSSCYVLCEVYAVFCCQPLSAPTGPCQPMKGHCRSVSSPLRPNWRQSFSITSRMRPSSCFIDPTPWFDQGSHR